MNKNNISRSLIMKPGNKKSYIWPNLSVRHKMFKVEVYHIKYPNSVRTFEGQSKEEAIAKAYAVAPPPKTEQELLTHPYIYKFTDEA